MCICIYIYIHKYIHTYIHTYMYRKLKIGARSAVCVALVIFASSAVGASRYASPFLRLVATPLFL